MKPLLSRFPDVPVLVAERSLMSRVVGFSVTRGYLAAFPRPRPLACGEVVEKARTVVCAEGLTDVSNVGAVFRSAAALGADGVLVAPTCADPLERRALRVSMGAVLRLPWARTAADDEAPSGDGAPKEDGAPENGAVTWPQGVIDLLHERGFACWALALGEGCVSLADERLARPEKVAVFLGSEGWGLSEEVMRACDERVTIPMARNVDSLNVATAGAVALWELARR